MIHLFGHTVQWNVDAQARELGLEQPVRPSEDWLRRLRAYELEACSYSVRLFHDLGITDLDAWLSDFAACDLAYLEHFYRTGKKREFRSFWRDDQPLIAAVEIPPFQPRRWVSRWAGIVV